MKTTISFIAVLLISTHLAVAQPNWNLTQLGTYEHLSWQTKALTLSDNLALLTKRDTLLILDCSRPDNIRRAGHYQLPGSLEHVVVDNGYAYCAIQRFGIIVVDIRNLADIREVGRAEDDEIGSSPELTLANGKLFALNPRLSGVIFDISNPAEIHQTGAFEGRQFYGIKASGDLLYCCSDSRRESLIILDVSNPDNIRTVGSVGLDYAKAVEIQGDRAVVLARLDSLYIVDISNPAQPSRVGSIATGLIWQENLSWIGDFIYCYSTSILQVFRIDPQNQLQFVARSRNNRYIHAVFAQGNNVITTESSALYFLRNDLAAFDQPEITADPVEYDFGSVNVGDEAQFEFTIRNTGLAPLVIDSLYFLDPERTHFSANLEEAIRLEPEQEAGLNVEFAPIWRGEKNARLVLHSNDPIDTCLYLPVSGIGRMDGEGSTIRVPGDFDTIQRAILAADSGDTILLMESMYRGPGNVNLIWEQPIVLLSLNGVDDCTIDCENVEGAFTMQGIAGITIKEITFTGAEAGAIYFKWTSSLDPYLIEKCRFIGNSDSRRFANRAGAITTNPNYQGRIRNCLFINNSASEGGAIRMVNVRAVIEDCQFIGNSAGNGGAIFIEGQELTVRNCLFEDNQGGAGGGLYISHQYGRLNFHNNTLVRNSAVSGGAVYVRQEYGGLLGAKDCIFWENTSRDSTTIYSPDSIRALVTFSCIDEEFPGEGNFNDNPGLTVGLESTWGSGDAFLNLDSPCINAGSRTADSAGLSGLTASLDLSDDIGRGDLGFHRLPSDYRPGGFLAGTISDRSTGNLIRNASVSTNYNRVQASDSVGYWEMPFARSGVFDLIVSAEGFSDTVLADLELAAGDTLRFNLDLQRPVGVNEPSSSPYSFALSPCFPNPFNSSTTITFSLPSRLASASASLAIYDLQGRIVSELTNERMEAGEHKIVWDAGNLGAGVYFVKLISGNQSTIQKVVLVP